MSSILKGCREVKSSIYAPVLYGHTERERYTTYITSEIPRGFGSSHAQVIHSYFTGLRLGLLPLLLILNLDEKDQIRIWKTSDIRFTSACITKCKRRRSVRTYIATQSSVGFGFLDLGQILGQRVLVLRLFIAGFII